MYKKNTFPYFTSNFCFGDSKLQIKVYHTQTFVICLYLLFSIDAKIKKAKIITIKKQILCKCEDFLEAKCRKCLFLTNFENKNNVWLFKRTETKNPLNIYGSKIKF